MTPKTIKDKKATLAQKAGVAPEEVGSVRLQLQKLQTEGVLVDVDFHGGHMFTTRATYQELGIPDGDVRRQRIRAGSKNLIPAQYLKKLRSLETRFRQSLDKYSFQIGAFGAFRWVPFTAYDAWREEWDRLQDELAALKTEILDHYWDFMDALAADFAKVAREAWDAITARRGDADFALQAAGGTFTNCQDFVDHVVARAQDKMPDAHAIEAGLYADYRTAVLLGMADLEEDRLAADRHVRQLEAERQAADEDYQKAREAFEERQAKIDAMRRAELEHARRQMQEMGAPINQALLTLRAQMNQDAQEILAGLNKHGKLRGRAADRVANLVKTFHLLGGVEVMDDAELGGLLDQMKDRLDSYRSISSGNGAARDAGLAELMASLHQIAATTHDAAETVKAKMGSSRFAHLEV